MPTSSSTLAIFVGVHRTGSPQCDPRAQTASTRLPAGMARILYLCDQMALIQALLALLGRSVGKIAEVVFGWAVVALFGRGSQRQQWVRAVVVGAATLWPLMLLGVALPRVATFLLAFVPLSSHVPHPVMRFVFLALTLILPLGIGLAMTRDATHHEALWLRLVRGYPVTIALAGSLVFLLLTLPFLRLIAAARRQRDEHVPCLSTEEGYPRVVREVDEVLHEQAIDATRHPPPWWLTVPSVLLRALGGPRFRALMPERLAFWRGPQLSIALYPSDVFIRGAGSQVALVHGLIVEAVARGPGLQTFDPKAQAVERQLHQVWAALDGEHRVTDEHRERLQAITRQLSSLPVAYDDWASLYRQALQLGRALDGERELLASSAPEFEVSVPRHRSPRPAPPEPRPAPSTTLGERPTGELLRTALDDVSELVKTQVALAKAELQEDKEHELRAAGALMIAGLAVAATAELLLVGALLWIARHHSLWSALLWLGVPLAVIATVTTVVGWRIRVRHPLARSRRQIEEERRWLNHAV
jgi:uncharacterized membrane protein YqjE